MVGVTRDNYVQHAGQASDLVIDASCNSRKYLADDNPVEEFQQSVAHRMRTLHDFRAPLQVHVSSVDVYDRLDSYDTTHEDSPAGGRESSHYGHHKYLTEQLVQHYAPEWLILRLSGMVGPGMRKNPVFDITDGKPLRIHPESQYQFMHTGDVVRIAWRLVEERAFGEVFNFAGTGLISPRRIAELAGLPLDLHLVPADATPRIVAVDTSKLRRRVGAVPETEATVAAFCASL